MLLALMAHLECVPGQGDISKGDDLAVGLPNLKVLEQHLCRGWLEGLTLKLLSHHHLYATYVYGRLQTLVPCYMYVR